VFAKLIGVTATAKLATTITYISPYQLNVQLQTSSSGTALLYVVNSYGTIGIKQVTFA
jgi:hypothetical protein